MTATVAGFSIQTAGVILIVAGVVRLLISLFLSSRMPTAVNRVKWKSCANASLAHASATKGKDGTGCAAAASDEGGR